MKKNLSIFSANLAYLFTMLLVIGLGGYVQTLNLSVGLIITEVGLILLPAVLFLKAGRVPLKAGLGLNPVGPAWIGLGVLMGAALAPLGLWIDLVMAQLTGMAPVPLAADGLPRNLFDAGVYFIALAFFAPLCEELLFRGAIQGAYTGRRSPGVVITITALLFAFYHFRVTGLPALLPPAFILGYLAWRSGSVYPGIGFHFGMNATSALHTLIALLVNGVGLPLASGGVVLGGVVVAGVCLYGFKRLCPAPVDVPVETPQPAARLAGLKDYGPLVPAALLYLGVAYLTVATPAAQVTPSSELKFHPPAISAPIESRYQILNQGGQEVGQMTCRVSPAGARVRLECSRQVQGYELKLATSYFLDLGHTATWRATWDSQTLDLLDFVFVYTDKDGHTHGSELKDGQLITTGGNQVQPASAPRAALLEYEWAWRCNDLNADLNSLWNPTFGYLSYWDESQKRSGPTFKPQLLAVRPAGGLDLPAGHFDAWQVTVAGQSAWYTRGDPFYPRPIQFDDGALIYRLIAP